MVGEAVLPGIRGTAALGSVAVRTLAVDGAAIETLAPVVREVVGSGESSRIWTGVV